MDMQNPRAWLLLGMTLCLVVFSFVVNSAWAQGTPSVPKDPATLKEGIDKVKDVLVTPDTGLAKKENVADIIASLITWLLGLSALLAMGVLVWGGIMYIMSLGDEGRAGKAKQIIMYAIIGVIIILMSFVIISFVKTLLTAALTASSKSLAEIVVIQPAEAAGICDSVKGKPGFNAGIAMICEKIKPTESGLATDTNIASVIIRIVNLLLSLVAILALAALVWGSIMYIISIGEESKVEKAKKVIFYAIGGVVLAGLSFLILKVVQGIIAGP